MFTFFAFVRIFFWKVSSMMSIFKMVEGSTISATRSLSLSCSHSLSLHLPTNQPITLFEKIAREKSLFFGEKPVPFSCDEPESKVEQDSNTTAISATNGLRCVVSSWWAWIGESILSITLHQSSNQAIRQSSICWAFGQVLLVSWWSCRI